MIEEAAADGLVYLRLLELAVLFALTYWVTWQPPSPYRTKRLLAALLLIILNVLALVWAVAVVGIKPW